jgi:hypothetical protein
LLRAAALVVVTIAAFVASWQLASSVAVERATVASQARAETAARGSDYGYLGISEALTVPRTTRAAVNGQMVVFGLGVPVTVTDGIVTRSVRVPRATTVTEALRLAGVQLGPIDRVEVSERQDGTVASGDVLRIVRVTESDVVVRESVPFAVQTVQDPTLAAGRTLVVRKGVPGVLENTYRVQSADGTEEGRTLIVSVRLSEPETEIRHLGTKVVVIPPPAGGDMEAIIRAAAARHGADPAQLLRVAYCESRYNPSAYNKSSGASGLFQFLATTWAANSVRAGYAGASVFDPVANANTAAWMFARGQQGQWSCK